MELCSDLDAPRYGPEEGFFCPHFLFLTFFFPFQMLMTIFQSRGYSPLSFVEQDRRNLFSDLLAGLSVHPNILSVEDVDYLSDYDLFIICRPFSEKGSLRVLISLFSLSLSL